ncbi:MAG: hypothetical protein Q8T11_01300 [Elusimicrobiota bacterium]|nr:hypothetical protein [Elusimicrobiota bacterium]
MRLFLPLLVVTTALSGCFFRNTSAKDPNVEAASAGPCRDDEGLVNGKCSPRIPGD